MEEQIPVNTYELTILLSSDLSEFDVQKVIDKVKSSIIAKGGNILEELNWGKKRLAYPIGQAEFGHYQTLIFDSPKQTIVEIDKDIRLTPEILRYLLISIDKEGITIDQLFTPEKEATQVVVNMKEKTEGVPHQTRATRRKAAAIAEIKTSITKDSETATLKDDNEVEKIAKPIIETKEEVTKRREELDKKLDELLKEE